MDTTQILKIQKELAKHALAQPEVRHKRLYRLALEVLARDATCQVCGGQPASEVHHNPPWQESLRHRPKEAIGVCSACHRQKLHNV